MLSSLSITAYHGIDQLDLVLDKKTHIIWANGSGKTHILDALHLLAGSRPLYGETHLDIGSRIEGVFWDELPKSYVLTRDDAREYMLIQWSKMTRPKYLAALPFHTVYISPFDMNMLYFAPQMRRDYLDDVLARTHEQFPRVKRDYEQTMRQRNALLKRVRDGEAAEVDLDFWDAKFSELAAQYGVYRQMYRSFLTERFLDQMFSPYGVRFAYQSEWIDHEDPAGYILETLRATRQRDIHSWHTHIGPHRDDWSLEIPDGAGGFRSIQFYLSRGETKMLLLGLKMLEAHFLDQKLEKTSILLVDDIFAELDDANAISFLKSITKYQTILTSQKPLPSWQNWDDFTCIVLKNP